MSTVMNSDNAATVLRAVRTAPAADHADHTDHAGQAAVPPLPPLRFPRAPLFALGGLVLAVLLTVGAVRLTGVGALHVPDAAAVAVREFRFEDRPDGSIAVLDASGGRLIDSVAPGSNGFLRGTMRGLARERKRQGVGADVPFRMVGRADGKLTLEDPATGRRVDLGSFGPTNAAVFAQIMASPVR